MDLKRNFVLGTLDKDTDNRLLPPGKMRDALNVRASTSEGSDVGAIENCLGNEALTALTLGDNVKTIGADRDVSLNTIYWLTKSDDRTCFIEYNANTDTATKILEDTRTGTNRVLNLSENFPVNRIVIIIDSDNDKVYACWTDNNDTIRFINIERAKTYGTNGFIDEDISLIKKPPLSRPEITLTNTASEDENNLEEKFIRFAYRYKYLDGEYSALSPFSDTAFLPKAFSYDYSTNSNESMVNTFNKAEIEINTGSERVVEIEVVFKESRNNTVYRIEPFKKSDESWSDNATETIEFFNNKIHKVLPADELKRLYDNVPLKAKALEIIGNQLMFGNYTENYNLIDIDENQLVLDFTMGYDATSVTSGTANKSVKSIRDYEAGIAYVFPYGRLSSVLTTKDTTEFIAVDDSEKKNKLYLNIGHKAPAEAIGYRTFVKQSKDEYDTIVPTLFYEDGVYVWIKLENGEQNKLNEGDFLIVKSDTSGILDTYQETRVIEVKEQVKNFLEDDPEAETDTLQEPGLYFKVKPDGYYINESDFVLYEWKSYDDSGDSSLYENPIQDEANVIEDAVYYGAGTLNDLTASGTYTNNTEDIRYIVRIDATGTPDTFEWSDDDGDTWTTGVSITGAAQTLNNGVEVTFANTTGHDTEDEWIISAKGKDTNDFGGQEKSKAYLVLKGPEGDTIFGGARIEMTYREFNEHDLTVKEPFTASKTYKNLEEWFYGDGIAADFGVQFEKYWFRKGTVSFVNTRNIFKQNPSGTMCMIIRSIGTQNNESDGRAKIEGFLNIFQSETNILFETKSKKLNSDIFYEFGPTYSIDEDGYHLGKDEDDTNQTSGNDAKIYIEFYNCYCWGNGFESYKIKDTLTGNGLGIDTRPLTTLDEYKQNVRRSSITWGGKLEQTTKYNALNEFNLSLTNYIDLDDSYGGIQYLHNTEKLLVALQENKVQRLGYRNTEIYDQDGASSFIKSDNILSILQPYSGEYGISIHPESFSYFGNRLYFTDQRRGTPLRLSIDGITELSMYGMNDWFKDIFRNYPNNTYVAAYDPYFDEYLLTIKNSSEIVTSSFTIGFSEKNKGWTPRMSFVQDRLIGLNNRLYSVKNGVLYLHNSENVPRNNFNGEQYDSQVTVVFNESPSDDKIFKTIQLEGNDPWDIDITTNLSESTINDTEFEQRESRYFAYTRRNEDANDKSSFSTQGTGNILDIDGNKIKVATTQYVTTNDVLYQVNAGVQEEIGVISDINKETNELTINTFVNTPVVSNFSYIKKNARIEGGAMRGYFMEVTASNSNTESVELFSINTKVAKSYV